MIPTDASDKAILAAAVSVERIKAHIDVREGLLKGILDRLAENAIEPGEFKSNLVRLIQIDNAQGRLDELALLRSVLSRALTDPKP
jgi:hypothetical protein